MSNPQHETFPRIAPVAWGLGVLAAAFLFFGRFAVGRIPVSTDMILMYAPFYSLRWDGGPPLWNPYLAGGMSMAGNLQFSAWYPPRWPFYFLSDWRSYFGIFMFLHHLIALAGAWGSLRAMRLTRPAALLGAVVFACGGCMVARIMNTTIFLASCWFPWLVWGAAATRKRGGLPALTGMAMIILTGSPHLILYGAIGFGVAWAILRCGTPPENAGGGLPSGIHRFNLGAWVWLAGGVVLGLPALIPGLIQVGGSIRTLTDMKNNLADSLRWSDIPFSLLGGSGGAMVPEVNDKCVYIGVVGLALVMLASLHPPLRHDRRWWCGWGLVGAGLALALGKNIGWQFILPWLPGLRLIEGPARALVLTAFGLALICGLGIEAVEHMGAARRRCTAGILALLLFVITLWTGMRPPSGVAWGEMLIGWLTVPGSVIGRSFAVWDGWLMLAPTAGLLVIWPRSKPGLPWALGLLMVTQLWHFSPRVGPQTESREYFDPPSNVRFLMERARTEDFRIAAFDCLQSHDVEWDNLHKFKFLMPNLSTLYGLKDIRGFDPLITLEHQALIRETAGLAPFNDPIRNVDIGRPDEELFRRTGVRYLIGHPGDRRITHLPMTLTPDRPAAEVEAWRTAGITEPVGAWQFVSLVDGRNDLPSGTIIAELIIECDERTLTFPVRIGGETMHIAAGADARELQQFHVNMRWATYTPFREEGFRRIQQNYRTVLELNPEPPAPIRRVRWKLLRTDVLLHIAAQGCRISDKALSGSWARVHDDPVAPVYELRGPESAAGDGP